METQMLGDHFIITKMFWQRNEHHLSEETLIGLRRSKQFSRNAGGAHQALVSKRITNIVKDAHLNHTIRNMQRKEERQKKQSKQAQEDQYRKKRELEENMSKSEKEEEYK